MQSFVRAATRDYLSHQEEYANGIDTDLDQPHKIHVRLNRGLVDFITDEAFFSPIGGHDKAHQRVNFMGQILAQFLRRQRHDILEESFSNYLDVMAPIARRHHGGE